MKIHMSLSCKQNKFLISKEFDRTQNLQGTKIGLFRVLRASALILVFHEFLLSQFLNSFSCNLSHCNLSMTITVKQKRKNSKNVCSIITHTRGGSRTPLNDVTKNSTLGVAGSYIRFCIQRHFRFWNMKHYLITVGYIQNSEFRIWDSIQAFAIHNFIRFKRFPRHKKAQFNQGKYNKTIISRTVDDLNSSKYQGKVTE